jgi:hypothetical protein
MIDADELIARLEEPAAYGEVNLPRFHIDKTLKSTL